MNPIFCMRAELKGKIKSEDTCHSKNLGQTQTYRRRNSNKTSNNNKTHRKF